VSRGTILGDPGTMPPHPAKLSAALRRILGPTSQVDSNLVVCHVCGSDFVNPVSWHEQGDTDWWMRLRCGECGFVREVEVDNEAAERYDAALDRGVERIDSTLAGLDRARMVAQAEALRVAFDRDLIGPADFRT
jgi:uncharacterized Zn finger protein